MKDELRELMEAVGEFMNGWTPDGFDKMHEAYWAIKEALEPEDIFQPGNILSHIASGHFCIVSERTLGNAKYTILTGKTAGCIFGFDVIHGADYRKEWRLSSLEEAAQYQRKNMTGETIRAPEVKLDKW
jgi:hypothetical protein